MSGMYKIEGEQVVALPSTLAQYSKEIGAGLARLEEYDAGISACRAAGIAAEVNHAKNINEASLLWLKLGTIQQLRRDFVGIYGPGIWWEKKYVEDRTKNPLEYVCSLRNIIKGVGEKAINGGSVPLDVVQSLYTMCLDIESSLYSQGELLEGACLENRWSELMFDLHGYPHVFRWWGEVQRAK